MLFENLSIFIFALRMAWLGRASGISQILSSLFTQNGYFSQKSTLTIREMSLPVVSYHQETSTDIFEMVDL